MSDEEMDTFEASNSDSFRPQKRRKPLRMRMYADDEELKAKAKASRSYEDFSKKKRSVHSRLLTNHSKDDLCHLGTYRDYDRDYDRDRSYHESPMYREIAGPRSVTDLREKLKKLRSDQRRNTGEHSKNYVEHGESGYNVKGKNKSYYKRKHRSPLCVDDDDEDDFEESSSSGE